MDEKEIDWRGSSYRDLMEMPEGVRKTFGYALSLAQNGMRHPDTKQLTGFKPATIEILEDDDGDTYRGVYTAHYEDIVYVLHCFKKKSTRGRNLPKADKRRSRAASQRCARSKRRKPKRGRGHDRGTQDAGREERARRARS